MEDNLVDYIEKTPLGIKSITLKNGKPYESVKKINGKEVITRYNKKTGAPLWNRKSDPNFRYYELFAEDGKTVIKEIKTPRCAGKGDIEIIEHNADGSKTVKLYINATMDKVGKIKGQVSSVEKLTPEGKTIKSILLDPDTNTIRSYANIINL